MFLALSLIFVHLCTFTHTHTYTICISVFPSWHTHTHTHTHTQSVSLCFFSLSLSHTHKHTSLQPHDLLTRDSLSLDKSSRGQIYGPTPLGNQWMGLNTQEPTQSSAISTAEWWHTYTHSHTHTHTPLSEIESMITKLLLVRFSAASPTTFSVVCDIRSCNTLKKMDLITKVLFLCV